MPGDPLPPAGRPQSRRGLWLGLLGIPALIGGLWFTGLMGLAAHAIAIRSLPADRRADSLWFGGYSVGIDRQGIDGLTDNVSGLTYNAATDTLFTAINRPAELAELSRDGRLLRRIALIGATDVEGITHVDDNRFILVDEGRHRLSWVTIDPDTTMIDVDRAPFLTLDIGVLANLGFEGVSWDQHRKELVLVQEMQPVRVLVIGGLDKALAGQGLGVTVREWHPDSWAGHFLADLSSVTVHDATGNLVLLSDMTSALVEYSPDGAPISLLTLWAGWHGLADGVPQAEGVAIAPEGTVYIVSEPNLFYRFDRPGPTRWGRDGQS